MKIKEVIASAAIILGHRDVVDLIGTDASETEIKNNSNFNILFRCANLVIADISTNYIDCITKQTFDVEDGKIEFSQFDKTFLKVKNVKKDGIEMDWQLFIDFLKVPNGRVEVTYACVPSFTNGCDDTAIAGIADSVLTFGILAEYAFVSGMFNEAKVWNEKFEQLLFGSLKHGKAKKMPAR